ncbi:hypothetical protein RA24_00425 [Leisingera sp. ANG-M6]|nr:hypothetical protein RA24_00425 [Leisingera sp. ANG-M6]
MYVKTPILGAGSLRICCGRQSSNCGPVRPNRQGAKRPEGVAERSACGILRARCAAVQAI